MFAIANTAAGVSRQAGMGGADTATWLASKRRTGHDRRYASD